MIENLNCVVLNSTYEPLGVMNVTKALVLTLEGKAIIVEEHPEHRIRSVKQSFPVPLRIALKRYIERRITNTKLTRKHLFVRDSHTCQYCLRTKGQLKSHEFLTRDHIIPESRGGKNSWLNLTTACSTCNNKKGDRTPEEANMTLHSEPRVPSVVELWAYKIKHY